MKSRQSFAIPPRILTVSLVVLVASALLATLLMASILYSDRKNGEVATLRAEIEALKQGKLSSNKTSQPSLTRWKVWKKRYRLKST